MLHKCSKEAQKAADAALEDADKALKKINEFATVEPEVVAAANPFTTKLPGASDLAAIGAPTEAQKQELRTAREALNTAMENLDTQIDTAEQAGKTELKAQLQAKKNELEAKVNSMTDLLLLIIINRHLNRPRTFQGGFLMQKNNKGHSWLPEQGKSYFLNPH